MMRIRWNLRVLSVQIILSIIQFFYVILIKYHILYCVCMYAKIVDDYKISSSLEFPFINNKY